MTEGEMGRRGVSIPCMAQCWKRQISSGRLRLTRSEIPMVASTTARKASAGECCSKLRAYG